MAIEAEYIGNIYIYIYREYIGNIFPVAIEAEYVGHIYIHIYVYREYIPYNHRRWIYEEYTYIYIYGIYREYRNQYIESICRDQFWNRYRDQYWIQYTSGTNAQAQTRLDGA